MRELTVYECEFCKELVKEKEKAATHENNCSFNPKNKTCGSCYHYNYLIGGMFCTDENGFEGEAECRNWNKRV